MLYARRRPASNNSRRAKKARPKGRGTPHPPPPQTPPFLETRQATRAEIRALLTPEQRSKYDVSPQSLGGGLPADPANMAMALEQAVGLTSEQKKKATDIFWDDITDQIAALPPDQNLKAFA